MASKVKRKRRSAAWKDLERAIAKTANEFGLTAHRVLRGADFSKKDVDVEIDECPWLRIDGKYRQRHAVHSFVREIEKKYCKGEEDVPLLVTKQAKEPRAYAIVPLWFFMGLLGAVYSTDKGET